MTQQPTSATEQLKQFPMYSVTQYNRTQLRFVHNGRYTFIYSYKTPIGIFDNKTNALTLSLRASRNGYSKTTSRHTNIVRAMFQVDTYKMDEMDMLELAAEVYEITPSWN